MRGLEPVQQVLHVRLTVFVGFPEHGVSPQPVVRNRLHDAVNDVGP